MITSAQCQKTFGQPAGPNEGKYMSVWPVPADIQAALAHVIFSAVGKKGFPAKIYCHRLLQPKLETALRNVIARGLAHELKTWDGCYLVRAIRGAASPSLHSWGLAIDINAATNALGAKPTMSACLVKCFTDAGLEWGGGWSRPDGMHFQLSSL